MVCSTQRNKGGARRAGDIRGVEYAVGVIPPTGRESGKARAPHASFHPLTEPEVSPATMCFCAAKNITTAGRIVSVIKASTRCQSVEYSPW